MTARRMVAGGGIALFLALVAGAPAVQAADAPPQKPT
jgi:hypothetical protein